jgi:tetratricopeptide (TPR) repeat protein
MHQGKVFELQTDLPGASQQFMSGIERVDALEARGLLDQWPEMRGHRQHLQDHLEACRRLERAASDLAFVLAQQPEQISELLYHRARILAHRGQHAEAAEAAERLASLAPNSPDRRNVNDWP